ncbi:MAG: hypothetical protein K9M07_04705 [Simkaniaceae bacterium]|nr:hypothetical protein [Simkaniaceae bacterium]
MSFDSLSRDLQHCINDIHFEAFQLFRNCLKKPDSDAIGSIQTTLLDKINEANTQIEGEDLSGFSIEMPKEKVLEHLEQVRQTASRIFIELTGPLPPEKAAMHFKDYIQELHNEIKSICITPTELQHETIILIAKGFDFPHPIDEVERAKIILSVILPPDSYEALEAFLKMGTDEEQFALIQDLIYQFYFEESSPSDINAIQIFRIAAAHLSYDRMSSLINADENPSSLITELFIHYDEGSYILKKIFQTHSNPVICDIVNGLDRGYYDLEKFRILSLTSRSFDEIQIELKRTFDETSSLAFDALNRVCPLAEVAPLDITLEQFQTFCLDFGLYGHDFDMGLCPIEHPNLYTWLENINAENIGTLKPELLQLHSYITQYFDRSHLTEQFNHLAVVLPTCGKELSKLPFLPSVIESMQLHHSKLDINIRSRPIIVIDQSTPDLFTKNKRFATSLDFPIVYVSKEEALMLAKKLGITELISTTEDQQFGYGGARNACSLLGPIIQHMAMLKGVVSMKVLLDDPRIKEEGLTILKNIVDSPDPSTQFKLLMGDDDLEMPPSDFLINLMKHSDDDAFQMVAKPQIGRNPQRDELIPLFRKIKRPIHMMLAGAISYPQKLCAPHPFGSEEDDMEFKAIHSCLSRSAHHLATARYPAIMNPKEAALTMDVTHHIRLFLTRMLGKHTGVLPYTTEFSQDSYRDIISEGAIVRSTSQFWEHWLKGFDSLSRAFAGKIPRKEGEFINAFLTGAISLTRHPPRTETERNSLRTQLDALARRNRIDAKTSPTAYCVYRLARTIGTGLFQDQIANIMRSRH